MALWAKVTTKELMSKLVFISGSFRVTYKRKRAGSGKTLLLAPSTGQKPAGPLITGLLAGESGLAAEVGRRTEFGWFN